MRAFVFSLAFLGSSVAWGQDGQVSVRPAGVTLVWERGDKEAFEHMMVLNAQSPVTVALYVSSKGKKIVSFDRDKSKVTSLTDDQATKMKGEIGHFPRIAKDGSAAFIELRGDVPISSKAGSLLAKGELKVAVASKTSAKRSKVVPAAKGSKLELAEDLVFEISEAGKPSWGDDPFSVSLKIKRDIPEVAKVRFFDAEGQEIEASSAGSSRSGFLGRVTLTRDYNLKRKVDKLSVEMDLWTDLAELTVPFDVKLGVGGAK